jgi:hypothetical protein
MCKSVNKIQLRNKIKKFLTYQKNILARKLELRFLQI